MYILEYDFLLGRGMAYGTFLLRDVLRAVILEMHLTVEATELNLVSIVNPKRSAAAWFPASLFWVMWQRGTSPPREAVNREEKQVRRRLAKKTPLDFVLLEE